MSSTSELALKLGKLEDLRIQGKEKINKTALWIGIPTAAISLWLYFLGGILWLIVAGIGVFLFAAIRAKVLKKVTSAFKTEIMTTLVANIDPTLKYTESSCISEDEFAETSLYKRPDRYHGKDLVQGSIGQTKIRFSLINAEEKHEDRDEDGHTSTRYTTIFCGLLFIADFNKKLSGQTHISPGKAGWLSKLFGTPVVLEDPRFNSLFTVTSSNQIEARYILTPSMMERVLNLKTTVGDFRMSFIGDNLNIAINMKYNVFDPDLNRPLNDRSQVDSLLSKLKPITGIVEELDLNTRIWTK